TVADHDQTMARLFKRAQQLWRARQGRYVAVVPATLPHPRGDVDVGEALRVGSQLPRDLPVDSVPVVRARQVARGHPAPPTSPHPAPHRVAHGLFVKRLDAGGGTE